MPHALARNAGIAIERSRLKTIIMVEYAERTMTYRTFEHTADIGIEVDASNLDLAFAEAAMGLTEVMTGGNLARPDQAPDIGDIELTADDLEMLLVRWLSELLYIFEVEGFLVGLAAVDVIGKAGNWQMKGRLLGETYAPDRHGYGAEVKAITYHQIEVEPGPPTKLRFILDL